MFFFCFRSSLFSPNSFFTVSVWFQTGCAFSPFRKSKCKNIAIVEFTKLIKNKPKNHSFPSPPLSLWLNQSIVAQKNVLQSCQHQFHICADRFSFLFSTLPLLSLLFGNMQHTNFLYARSSSLILISSVLIQLRMFRGFLDLKKTKIVSLLHFFCVRFFCVNGFSLQYGSVCCRAPCVAVFILFNN